MQWEPKSQNESTVKVDPTEYDQSFTVVANKYGILTRTSNANLAMKKVIHFGREGQGGKHTLSTYLESSGRDEIAVDVT